jgi:uroporphyrin-III C-methyltransferase
VAVVSRASQPDERVLETTLGMCVEDVAAQKIEPPAIVVIGEVVRLRAGLDWVGALGGRILDADPLGTRRTRDAG